jgi:hypothetical protein
MEKCQTVAPGIRNKCPGSGGGLRQAWDQPAEVGRQEPDQRFLQLAKRAGRESFVEISYRKGPGTAWLVRRLRMLHRQDFISSGMSKMKVGKLPALPAA